MIICDICKNLKAKAFEINIELSKMEQHKTRAKPTEKVIITIPMHLCDGCITNFNSRLGHFINDIRNEPAVIEVPSDEGLLESVKNKKATLVQ